MSMISAVAASARESARDAHGRFGEQGHTDPGQLGDLEAGWSRYPANLDRFGPPARVEETDDGEDDENSYSRTTTTEMAESVFTRRARMLLRVADDVGPVTVTCEDSGVNLYGCDTWEYDESVTVSCAGREKTFDDLPGLFAALDTATPPGDDDVQVVRIGTVLVTGTPAVVEQLRPFAQDMEAEGFTGAVALRAGSVVELLPERSTATTVWIGEDPSPGDLEDSRREARRSIRWGRGVTEVVADLPGARMALWGDQVGVVVGETCVWFAGPDPDHLSPSSNTTGQSDTGRAWAGAAKRLGYTGKGAGARLRALVRGD